jgi:SNF2 family DNA or RNA helicase
VVVPASLQGNYKKEVRKHSKGKGPKRSILSMQNLATKKKSPDDPMMIVDEAHRMRDPGSKTYQVLRDNKAKKRLLLTGSPFYNHPSDVAPLVNVAAGSNVLPADKEEFNKRYVFNEQARPSLVNTLRGVRPGTVERLNQAKAEELRNTFGKWIDHHPGSEDNFPAVTREDVRVPMSQEQLEVYDTIMGKAPSWVAHKVRSGLPPNKTEAKQMNAFLGGARQASNTTAPFQEDGKIHQPKVQAAYKNLKAYLDQNPAAKAVVYSNYLDAGVNPYRALLDADKIPYGEFTGEMPKAKRDELVKQYNENKLRALLLSSAGGEGLDLQGTRLMQILEPHWNNEKLRQVEGRGIRFKSHDHLAPEERKVRVERYLSTRPRRGILEQLKLREPGGSVDEYLAARAAEKERLIEEFRGLLPSGRIPQANSVPGGQVA